MEHTINQIVLRGTLASLPQFSHENHDRRFFRFLLEVPRLSGFVDTLPVIAEEGILNDMDLSGGGMLTVTGQIRSHNVRRDGRRHLLIFVFASAIRCEDGEPINDVILEGPICREPTYRRTPLGREICDVMLAVPRPYRRTDYIPCILWGKNAQEAADALPGAKLHVTGRLQSRDYVKVVDGVSQTRTAYELSVTQAEFPDAPDFLEETAAFF